MDGIEDGALYEDFLGECVAKTKGMENNNGYDDYYDNSLGTCEILDYYWVSFFIINFWYLSSDASYNKCFITQCCQITHQL